MATNEADISEYETGEPLMQHDEYVSGGDELDDDTLAAIGEEFVSGEGEGEDVGEEGEAEVGAPSDAPADRTTSEGGDEPAPTAEAATGESTLAPENEQPVDSPKFTYRADGTEYEVPGARIREEKTPEGQTRRIIEIPEDQWQQAVQPRLANREKLYQQRRELLQRIEERNAEYDPTVRQAEALIDRINGILALDDGELLEWRDEFLKNRPNWEAEQRQAALDAREAAMKGTQEDVDPIELQIAQEEVETELKQGLGGYLTQMLQAPEYAGLAVNTVLEDLWEMKEHLFEEAPQDMVIDGVAVRKGDPVIRVDIIERKLSRQRDILNAERARLAEAQKVEQQNQRVLGGSRRKPRQAGARSGGGAQPRNAERTADQYKDSADWRRDFMTVNEEDYADIL